MRSTWFRILLGLGSIAMAWSAWSWIEGRRDRDELRRAGIDFEAGSFPLARRRLAELSRRRPGWSEVAYQLGLCEERLGNGPAALSAWSRVPAEAPEFIKAAIGRALVLMNAGRYSRAEEVLAPVRDDRGPHASHIRQQIEVLLRIEGRTHEARELILEAWPGAADPSDVVRRLYLLEAAPFPIDYVRQALERGDPSDDRVWLGEANLAIWSGRFEEAARRLVACTERRPDDQAVWLSRLRVCPRSFPGGNDG